MDAWNFGLRRSNDIAVSRGNCYPPRVVEKGIASVPLKADDQTQTSLSSFSDVSPSRSTDFNEFGRLDCLIPDPDGFASINHDPVSFYFSVLS